MSCLGSKLKHSSTAFYLRVQPRADVWFACSSGETRAPTAAISALRPSGVRSQRSLGFSSATTSWWPGSQHHKIAFLQVSPLLSCVLPYGSQTRDSVLVLCQASQANSGPGAAEKCSLPRCLCVSGTSLSGAGGVLDWPLS